jgi:hypothetical protein
MGILNSIIKITYSLLYFILFIFSNYYIFKIDTDLKAKLSIIKGKLILLVSINYMIKF